MNLQLSSDVQKAPVPIGFLLTHIQADDDEADDPFKSRIVPEEFGVDELKEVISAHSDEEDYLADTPKHYTQSVDLKPIAK